MKPTARRGFMYYEDGDTLAGVAAALAEHRACGHEPREPNVVWVNPDAIAAPVALLGVWVRTDELVFPEHYLVGVE